MYRSLALIKKGVIVNVYMKLLLMTAGMTTDIANERFLTKDFANLWVSVIQDFYGKFQPICHGPILKIFWNIQTGVITPWRYPPVRLSTRPGMIQGRDVKGTGQSRPVYYFNWRPCLVPSRTKIISLSLSPRDRSHPVLSRVFRKIYFSIFFKYFYYFSLKLEL